MIVEPANLTIQGPFDPDMWDITVVHDGKCVRLRLSELGWKNTGGHPPSLFQEEVEKAFAVKILGHEGPGHTGDCFGDTCSRECICGKCPPLPEDAVACMAPTEERG